MANEPCKITVRDDLENGIQKYAELCAVITEKQSTIQDVIDCGRELASKAQSKEMYYQDGVSTLETKWAKISKLVEDRHQKLDSWQTRFSSYEEVHGAALRAKEDVDARIRNCEETQLEDIDLSGLTDEIEDVSVQTAKLNELSEPVIEEYRALSKTTDADEYIEGIGAKIDELKSDIKSFERRVQLMTSNTGIWYVLFLKQVLP